MHFFQKAPHIGSRMSWIKLFHIKLVFSFWLQNSAVFDELGKKIKQPNAEKTTNYIWKSSMCAIFEVIKTTVENRFYMKWTFYSTHNILN